MNNEWLSVLPPLVAIAVVLNRAVEVVQGRRVPLEVEDGSLCHGCYGE